MLTPGQFIARMTEWVDMFNRGSLDLPDDLLHRQATFRLNGTAYEDLMGRPVTDPIVRLVARGPGGYRLLFTALQYALTTPAIALRDLDVSRGLATCHADLTGQFRDTGAPFTGSADLALAIDVDGRITEVGLQMDPEVVQRILRARSSGESA